MVNINFMEEKNNKIIIYNTEDGQTKIDVRLENETVWLNQKQMAELFDKDIRTINEHIGNIYGEAELSRSSTIRNFRTVQAEGARKVVRDIEYYNLDVIISVGYRVKSHRGTQFRIWATQKLRDYIIKGFAMDDERLKNDGTILGKKYFEEQLQRIREIRLSERKFYQKITDIYATALDYDVTATATQRFFATVQNKLHWAIHGQTAAEVIVSRSSAEKTHMGLTTWQDAPHGKIQKFDVSVAKNYLTDTELAQLQRLVNAYLDIAEDMAQRNIPMTMADWEERLNRFIAATDRAILQDAGKVTAEIAKAHAESEFEKYRIVQDRLYLSDFDKQILALGNLENERDPKGEPVESRGA